MINLAILTSAAYNKSRVCVVDWSPWSVGELFTMAEYKAPDVAAYLASYIQNASTKYGFSLSNVNTIGHSLGAQIIGVAGNALGGKIGRAFGCDPTGT